ncbi:MAG TPA: hypothetical protein ENI76_08640 [Ignavibacteria bacterium]|nr:hypothetical protein [Ignavibacteria bacterium]
MKIKLIFSLSLLFAATNFLCAQVTTGKVEFKKIQKESVFPRPPSYDSTKTLEEQYTSKNQFQFIGLQLFLPSVINPKAGPIVFSKYSNGFTKGNRYYTVIDILQGNITKQLKQKKVINISGYRYKDFNSPQWKDLIIYAVFVLKENNKNDSLNNAPLYWVIAQSKQPPYSCSYFNSFIAVPYFVKQKQLYQNKEVIYLSNKSKWLCKEVTLLKSRYNDCKDSTYAVSCVLINNKGKRMQLRPPPSSKYGSFITEKEYNRLDHANRNQREELIKTENTKKEKYKSESINKFGQHFGELIAQHNIEIGMTAEMCKAAWGTPWKIDKTTTLSGSKEIWFYNWKYRLYFKNGLLEKVIK